MKSYIPVLLVLTISLIVFLTNCKDDHEKPTEYANVSIELNQFQFSLNENNSGRIEDVNWTHILDGTGSITFNNLDLETEYIYDISGNDLSNSVYEIPMGNYNITISITSGDTESWLPFTSTISDILIDSDQTLSFDGETDYGLLLLDTTWVDQSVTPTFDIGGTVHDFILRNESNYYYLYVLGELTGNMGITEKVYTQSLNKEVTVSPQTIHSYILELDSSMVGGMMVNFQDFTVIEDTIVFGPPSGIDGGLILYLPFNGNANDESGNGNDGILNGPVLSTDRFGNPNSSYDFDGVDDYISFNNTSLVMTQIDGVSYSLWFRLETEVDNHPDNLLSFLDDTQFGTILNCANGTSYLSSSIHPMYTLEHSNSIIPNVWYSMIVTSDFTTDETKFYLNGVLVNDTIATVEKKNLVELMIGKHHSDVWGYGWYFNGDIDDIRIYNRVITETEIHTLYGTLNDGLLVHYPFDGNANDESGNGNHGILGDGINTNTYPTLGLDRFGISNSSYDFDGVDDYIDCGSTLIGPTTNSPISVNAWLKVTSGTNGGAIISKYLNGIESNSNYGIGYNTDRVQVFGNGTDWINLNQVVLDSWVMVTTIFDDGVDGTKIYIDGDLIGQGTLTYNSVQSSINTFIGRLGGEPEGYFIGSIDDVRIYDRVLTESEIQLLRSF